MITDPFTEAARAEAEYRHPAFESPSTGRKLWPASRDSFIAGAEWARTYLEEQEPTDAEVEAAARELWRHRALGTVHPNYPWDGLAPELRQSLRELARAALSAARNAGRAEA